MTSRRGNARSRAIGKVKLGARMLGLGHEEYCDLLDRVTHRRSCADLDLEELGWVIEEMERLGARFVLGRRRRQTKPAPPEKAPLIRKIRALLEEAGRPEEYAEAILRRMTGHAHRTPLSWASPKQLHDVVAALEYDRQRGRSRRSCERLGDDHRSAGG